MREKLLSIIRGEMPEAILERMLSIATAPYARANGIEPICLSVDEVRLRMPMEGKWNSLGLGHGAATFLLADQTFAFAANMGPVPQVALNCQISYLRPVRGEEIRSRSRKLHEGRSTSLYEVSIYDDERLVAVMTCTGHKLRD